MGNLFLYGTLEGIDGDEPKKSDGRFNNKKAKPPIVADFAKSVRKANFMNRNRRRPSREP